MSSPETETKLTYTDHDGARHELRGCRTTVDHLGRYWIWSEQTKSNLVYRTKGREDALISALNHALFIIQLRDERIAKLQRIADLAQKFADEVKPDEDS